MLLQIHVPRRHQKCQIGNEKIEVIAAKEGDEWNLR